MHPHAHTCTHTHTHTYIQVHALAPLSNLVALTLTGNPISHTPAYRNHIGSVLVSLVSLDDDDIQKTERMPPNSAAVPAAQSGTHSQCQQGGGADRGGGGAGMQEGVGLEGGHKQGEQQQQQQQEPGFGAGGEGEGEGVGVGVGAFGWGGGGGGGAQIDSGGVGAHGSFAGGGGELGGGAHGFFAGIGGELGGGAQGECEGELGAHSPHELPSSSHSGGEQPQLHCARALANSHCAGAELDMVHEGIKRARVGMDSHEFREMEMAVLLDGQEGEAGAGCGCMYVCACACLHGNVFGWARVVRVFRSYHFTAEYKIQHISYKAWLESFCGPL